MDTKNFPGSWSAASNPNSIHSNPFQWVEAISAPSRWHSFALVASGRISQHVTNVSVTQWYSVSSVQEICSLPGRWSILKNNSMGLKELKKVWRIVARHNDMKQLHRYPTAWFCIFNLEGTQLIPLSETRIFQCLSPTNPITQEKSPSKIPIFYIIGWWGLTVQSNTISNSWINFGIIWRGWSQTEVFFESGGVFCCV